MQIKFRYNSAYIAVVLITFINFISIWIFRGMISIVIQGASIAALIYLVKFDVSHPYTTLLPTLYLYSYSFYIDGVLQNYDGEIMLKIQLLTWTAVSCLAISIGPVSNEYDKGSYSISNANRTLSSIMFKISCISLLIACFFSLVSGANSKRALALIESPILTLGNYAIQLMAIALIMILFSTVKEKEKMLSINVWLAILLSIICVITLGERDPIIRILIIMLLIRNSFYRKISPKQLGIYAIIGLIAIGFLQNIKSLAISGMGLSGVEYRFQLIPGEFYAAGRNMYVLFSNSRTFNHGNSIIDRVIYSINNLPLISTGIEVQPTTRWFNTTYYYNTVTNGGGKGFSLIADAYLYGGILSVIISFVLLGLLIRILYNKSCQNVSSLMVYFLFLPAVMHNFRGDFSLLTSYLLKYAIIPSMIILLLNKIRIGICYNGQKENL